MNHESNLEQLLDFKAPRGNDPQVGATSWVHELVPWVGSTSWVNKLDEQVGSTIQVHKLGPQVGSASRVHKCEGGGPEFVFLS